MIWQNPFAWLGLFSLVIPIAIHLLGRAPARREQFPTLRFLDEPRSLPARRTTLHDIPLLLVRVALLALAVAALAQPLLLTTGRQQTLERALARVVIVDTSFSAQRATPTGTSALANAQSDLARLFPPANEQTVISAAEPMRAIAGAAEWLTRHAGRADLVIVSDFQTSSVDSSTLADVPGSIGLRLVRIASSRPAAPLDVPTRVGNATHRAHVDLAPDHEVVTWSRTGDAHADGGITLLVGPAERLAAAATLDAAGQNGVALPIETARAIAVAFPGAPERDALQRSAKPPQTSWMIQALARVTRDATLRDAGASAGEAIVGGRPTLVFFPSVRVGTTPAVQLVASLAASRSVAPPSAELDPAVMGEDVLARWQREPSTVARPISHRGDAPTNSDGRWLWIAVLVLLGVEARMRRTRRPPASSLENTHDRATA